MINAATEIRISSHWSHATRNAADLRAVPNTHPHDLSGGDAALVNSLRLGRRGAVVCFAPLHFSAEFSIAVGDAHHIKYNPRLVIWSMQGALH